MPLGETFAGGETWDRGRPHQTRLVQPTACIVRLCFRVFSEIGVIVQNLVHDAGIGQTLGPIFVCSLRHGLVDCGYENVCMFVTADRCFELRICSEVRLFDRFAEWRELAIAWDNERDLTVFCRKDAVRGGPGRHLAAFERIGDQPHALQRVGRTELANYRNNNLCLRHAEHRARTKAPETNRGRLPCRPE